MTSDSTWVKKNTRSNVNWSLSVISNPFYHVFLSRIVSELDEGVSLAPLPLPPTTMAKLAQTPTGRELINRLGNSTGQVGNIVHID